MYQFDYSQIPAGFYEDVLETGHPVRRAWHLQKFERVIECLPEGQSILDIGCAAGSFLSRVPDRFTTQIGVDVDAQQIAFASARFGSASRRFQTTIPDGPFDVVTLIEVIEHLTQEQARGLLATIAGVLKPGGTLLMSTPNYTSAWPVLEQVVNRVSEVSYEEQHITKLNYFSAVPKLLALAPGMFTLEMKTTTHFGAPFLAALSLPLSMRVSRLVDHKRWKNPFGALVLLAFRRTFS